MEMFNGMFGKVANGMCRLSMNGVLQLKQALVIRLIILKPIGLQIATTSYSILVRNFSL